MEELQLQFGVLFPQKEWVLFTESKDKLFPYAEENVQKFLESEWEKDDVKEAVVGLRKLALEDKDNKVDGVVEIPGEVSVSSHNLVNLSLNEATDGDSLRDKGKSLRVIVHTHICYWCPIPFQDASKDDQISGLVSSVKWLMSSDRKAGALKQLQGLIWKQGYDNGDIKGHVYDDVAAALEQWRSTEGQKVYIYSSGSVQAQKLLFGQSLAGDLLPRIDGHFDTAVGAKQEAASYTAIVEKLDAKPEEIFFLTDIVKDR
ncbi:hypothetical protein MSG28_006947 [Choristoneura fumiferana]|uniref:Uncharacterized protein n=1 Tax=Choristoneura fumiferana TaxID=7141 RepID=A0ACC0JLY8_CHOFU|nr:hypothetical protein MSG28_006947 [Choristoneura fumiferana]